MESLMFYGVALGICLFAVLFVFWLMARYVPNTHVAVVEKLWSSKGSLDGGEIIALNGEAGYQSQLLRGGVHFGLWRWQYGVHKFRLVSVGQGKVGYVFSRVGSPLPPSQTLGRIVDCDYFQDVKKFIEGGGQKGRQRAILREGVYAINLAAFNVITQEGIFALGADKTLHEYHEVLIDQNGFNPVLVGSGSGADNIGVVTTHDGPSLKPDEIIAPAVATDAADPNFHNNYQDIEAFLRAGGQRGLQYAPLLDGTYFLNHWFATVELLSKQVVDIGNVGVVVSYYGKEGADTSGALFRHGERVHRGERGVWEKTLGPGKYPFNTYAGKIIMVPTTNFVLHWITGKTEGHKYDESLRSIDLITKDAYEPILPLSVVVHIDYQKAPNVIQRFGDVKKLITQTIDPMLSAYFRDIAHKKTMLELVHSRDEIQNQARKELRDKFTQFDIECVDVLIGRPESQSGDQKIEQLLDQLRIRQLSLEQIETYSKQEQAAAKLQTLNEANAKAKLQTDLTASKVKIEIEGNNGAADLARAEKEAQKVKVLSDAEAGKIASIGTSEADVLQKKVESFGDSRLYAMSILADKLTTSKQPIVPANLFTSGGKNTGVLDMLLSLMTVEKVKALTSAEETDGELVKK